MIGWYCLTAAILMYHLMNDFDQKETQRPRVEHEAQRLTPQTVAAALSRFRDRPLFRTPSGRGSVVVPFHGPWDTPFGTHYLLLFL